MILHIGYLGGKNSPPHPAILVYLPYAVWALVFFLALRKVTDNYYLFDLDRKLVFFHFECAGLRRITPYLAFDRIKGIVINGKICVSKSSRWYEYRVEVIEQDGQTHPMSDWLRENELSTLNQRATNLARIVDCECLLGKLEHALEIDRQAPDNVSLTLAHKPLHGDVPATVDGSVSLWNIFFGLIAAFALFLAGTAVIMVIIFVIAALFAH